MLSAPGLIAAHPLDLADSAEGEGGLNEAPSNWATLAAHRRRVPRAAGGRVRRQPHLCPQLRRHVVRCRAVLPARRRLRRDARAAQALRAPGAVAGPGPPDERAPGAARAAPPPPQARAGLHERTWTARRRRAPD